MTILHIGMSANFTATFLQKISIWYEFLCQYRGGGRFEKSVVLWCIDGTKNVGGAKVCILSELPTVVGAIGPPVPPPLRYTQLYNLRRVSVRLAHFHLQLHVICIFLTNFMLVLKRPE